MPIPSPLAGEGKLSRSDSRERGRRLSKLRDHAKEMRSQQTEAEHRLWQLVRAHRFAGYKFRRQVPLDFYVADFVCFAERLIIELDGGQHQPSSPQEAERSRFLEGQGYRILRFWNNDVMQNIDGVLHVIAEAAPAPLPPTPDPSPPLRGGRGSRTAEA